MFYKRGLLIIALLFISVLVYYTGRGAGRNSYPPEEWWRDEITHDGYIEKSGLGIAGFFEKELEEKKSRLATAKNIDEREVLLTTIHGLETKLEKYANKKLNATLFPNQKDGDRIYFFRSPSANWKNLSGSEGYVLVRDGLVVNYIVTLLN